MKLHICHLCIPYSLQLSFSSLKEDLSKTAYFQVLWLNSYNQWLSQYFIIHITSSYYEQRLSKYIAACSFKSSNFAALLIRLNQHKQKAQTRGFVHTPHVDSHLSPVPSPQTSSQANSRNLYFLHFFAREFIHLTFPEGYR